MSIEQRDALIQQLKANNLLQLQSIAEIRAGFEAMGTAFPAPPDTRVEMVDAGGVPAEWVAAPGASPDRIVLYFHGGGYVIGSLNTHRNLAAAVSRAAKARVLVLDYRLAPEHPFPAAVEDAKAAYRWLLAGGANPNKVVFAGDSAGGGLTIAALVAVRDAGEKLPAAGVCLSPWVDLEGLGESMTSKAAFDPMVQKADVANLAALYLAGADVRSPLAAPLHANLAGLPPLLVQVGTWETLLDDASRLVERAKKAGVEVTYEPWEGMIHVWQLFANQLDEGTQAIERIGEYVQKKTT